MLVKTTIQNDIANAFKSVMYQDEGREDAIDKLASKLADAVMNAIMSQTISHAGTAHVIS